MTEIYKLQQGKIIISVYNEDLSIGLLDLDPNQNLSKHRRPVDEELIQVCGSCVIKIFNKQKLSKEIFLKE